MLSKNKIKYLRSLKLKKFRQKYNNFVVEGEKIVLEMLKSQAVEIENIICSENWAHEFEHILHPFQAQILLAKPQELAQISSLKTAPEVLIIAQQLSSADTIQAKDGLSLYLDRIQDPGNFGTILRIADWFGIKNVFCSTDSADLYNPKVIQATMGAFLRVKVCKIAFDSLKAGHPQLPVYGTVLEGENVFKTRLSENGLIVIGSEGKGIAPEIRKHITQPIAIPAHPDGGAESLNAAVATGIVCATFRNFHTQKQANV